MTGKFLRYLILLIFVCNLSYSQTLTVDTIVNNGNPANRINLVFLGDGYTSSQQTKYISDVNAIVVKLFASSPFKEYSSFFNVYAIHVISTDSGAKHPNTASDCNTANPKVPVSSPNTALSATFDYGGVHRLLYCTKTSTINSILQQNFPLYDKGLIIVNTPYYGGSGGTFSTCSADPSSSSIMIHELGHSFAGLADEYGGTSCGGYESWPNVTAETNPSLIKWKNWIATGMPVPTPNATNCGSYPALNVGLYEGANYCNTGWYRPSCNCMMNMLGVPFCPVCYQTLVYTINNSISLIDSYQPSGAVTLSNGQSQDFSASFLTPVSNSILRTWKLDGAVVATNTNSFQVNGSNLTEGTHSLVLTATDSTYKSKTTMPVYTKTWTITKNGSVNVTLTPFNAVCANTPDFTLTGGSPSGGTYSGTGVSNGVFSPSSAGTGTHTITYTYDGVSANQSVTVKSIPNITTSGNTTICSGTNASLSASGATTYTWSPNISLNTSTGATVVASPSTNQAYNVTGTSNGCTNSQTLFVFVTSLPNVTVSSGSATICSGSNTTLTASGGSTYVWSPATGLNTSTGVSVTASPTLSTTYTVTGTSGNCSKSQTISVSVTSLPEVAVSPDASVCSGGNTALTASGASVYSWIPSTGLNTTSGASVTSTPAQTTTYTVTGTLNGCAKSQSVTVTVNQIPVISLTGNTSVCSGSNTTLTASGASTYVWTPSAGLNTTSGTTVIASPRLNTTYTVTGYNGACSGSQAITVTVKVLPDVTVSPDASVCSGERVTLTAGGATSYLWSPSGSLNSSTNSVVEAAPVTTVTYSVTGTTNGCSMTKSVTVTVNPLPVITQTALLPSCSGNANGSIDISVTGQPPYTFNWSNGAVTEDNQNLTPGNYSVTVTSSAGCEQTKDFQISSFSCSPVVKTEIINVKSSTAYFNWEKTPCSYGYKIREREVGTKRWKYFSGSVNDSIIKFSNLNPGVTYECQVMSYCNSDLTDSSEYSSLTLFTTLTNCIAPVSFTVEDISSNSAVIKWNATEATSYRVRVKKDGDADVWQPYIVRNGKTQLNLKNLSPATNYIWQIRSSCSLSSDNSNYTAFQSFTTLQQPPRMVEPDSRYTSDEVQLYPNPNDGRFLISAGMAKVSQVDVTVTDIYGKMVISQSYNSAEGEFKKSINISELPAGVYFVRIQTGDKVINKKITKQ